MVMLGDFCADCFLGMCAVDVGEMVMRLGDSCFVLCMCIQMVRHARDVNYKRTIPSLFNRS